MVDFKRLSDKAKDLVEKRGGTEGLKQDAEELKNIAKGQGSLGDKAKRAAEALKDPGERGGDAEAKPAAGAGRSASEGRQEPAKPPAEGTGTA